jgi:hypothetical protein
MCFGHLQSACLTCDLVHSAASLPVRHLPAHLRRWAPPSFQSALSHFPSDPVIPSGTKTFQARYSKTSASPRTSGYQAVLCGMDTMSAGKKSSYNIGCKIDPQTYQVAADAFTPPNRSREAFGSILGLERSWRSSEASFLG